MTDLPLAAPGCRSPGAGPLRRAVAVLAVAATVCACSRPAPRSPWTESRLARMTLRQKVAQLVMLRVPPLAAAPAPGDSSVPRTMRWAREGIGAVELAGGDAGAVAALADSLRRLPLAPLLATRADRGIGGRFAGATELPSADGLAVLGDTELARSAGEIAAAEAKAIGIDLVFVDGPALPADTSALVPPSLAPEGSAAYAAYVHALADAGRAPGVTAFRPPASPGDTVLRVARWDRSALQSIQLDYLDGVVAAGAAAVEPGFVAVPALTADSTPLPLSGVAVQGVIRRDLGFGGLVVADVSPGGEMGRRWGTFRAALGALQVGADLVRGVDDPGPLVDSLTAAVKDGRLPAVAVERAVERVFAAKRRAGLGVPPADTVRARLRSAASLQAASGAFDRTVVTLGAVPALKGCRKTVLVARPSADVATLEAELARRVPGLLRLNAWATARHGPSSGVKAFAGNDADCVVVADLPDAPVRIVDRIGAPAARDTSKAARRDTARFRADSAASVRDTAARRMVMVSLAADPARALPAAQSAVLAWGAGPQAQRSAVRALFGEIARGSASAPRPRASWPPARVLVRSDARLAAMNPATLGKIDDIVQRGVDAGVFTSAAVAVARHGRLVKLRGYGHVAGHAVDPATTLFDLASLTKVVGTTPSVMALVDDGKIALGSPVYRYLPQFRGGGRGDVTVWNLLTHTSGLPAGDDLYAGAANADEALNDVIHTELVTEPGKQMVYSDFGMILMAETVHRRAGETVDRFAARRVFVPLGMQNTMYDPPLVWWDRTVPSALRSERPYVLREVVHDGNSFRLGGVAGHAGLFSTAGDLAIYSQTLLNGGAYGYRRIWSPRTVQEFTTRQPNASTRALGWDTPAKRSSAGDYFSPRSFGHTGYTGTSIWIDPERDLFVVLLTNRVYDTGTEAQILAIRAAVADAAATAITDVPIRPRPGTAAAEAEAAAARARERARHRAKHPARGRRGSAKRTTAHRRTRGH